MILKNSSPKPLSCAEFQEQLPDLFAAGGGYIEDPDLREHLRTCENCSALVRDLQYIADQAKQLLQPTHEPSDNVWKKIQEGLASDSSYAAKSNEK
jgi:hypothetical protein